MDRTASTPCPARFAAVVVVSLTLAACAAPAARAAEFFVNNASASCSNTGPGTTASPYCTITAALAAHHEPGVIITVLPGLYREQVTLPASGTPGSPITLRAQAGSAPVVVDGTNDFSDPALWTQSSGNVWLASSVTTAPKQVFADDQRLAPSTAAPASLPSRSFTFVAGSGLFVNAGGGNPGTHRTQVGTRVRGFFASGKSFVVISGFTVTRCEDRCIQLTNSSNIDVNGNTLTFSGGFGMQASGDSADRIVSNVSSNHAGHGFSLIGFTVEMTIDGNEAFGNVDPAARRANGIFVSASSRNVIRNNRWHDNQDSGEQFSPGSVDNVSIQNRSWKNGDHGFDHNGATGTLHIHEVAYGNVNDGFSIEGTSTGTRVFDSIAIENGVGTNGFDLFVDTLSTAGLQSNDNVLWNSGPQPPVRISQSVYPTVAGYSAARGQDTRTQQADPRFAGATSGNFELTAGSPAIDNGNSSVPSWPNTDAQGRSRHDDPGVPNRGQGPVTIADRGALEFQGSSTTTNQPPVARLTVTPNSGTAPLAVHADATASTDADGHIVSYQFDFGDGTVVGPQAAATANHSYAAGQFTAKVTVTDDAGGTGTATVAVNVTPANANQPPVARLTVTPNSGTAPLAVRADATASTDADGHIVSFLFDFGDGTEAGPQTTGTANHTYAAGQFTAKVTVTDDAGATASATAKVSVTGANANQPPLARLTVTPNSGTAPLAVRADASESRDRDGRIVSYKFDFGDGAQAGPQTTATANHTYAAGEFTAKVTVTDDLGATATAAAHVSVQATTTNRAPEADLQVEPHTGRAPMAVRADASGSRDQDGRIVSYRFDFGDGTTVGPQGTPIATHTYREGHFTASVLVTDDKGATATATRQVQVSAPLPSNFVGNSSFEVDMHGWATVGSARMQRVSGGHSGNFSLLVMGPLLGLGSFGITDVPDWVQSTDGAGLRYHFRAWVRSELGVGIVKLRVHETLGDRSGPTMSSSELRIGSGWAPLDLDFFTSFRGSQLDLQIVESPSIVGSALRIDDVSIVRSDVIGTLGPLSMGSEEAEEGPVQSAFTAAGVHPNPMRADGARIVFSTQRPGASEVVLFDLAGRAVRRLATDPSAGAGVQFVAFDGRGEDGSRLPGGIYYYQVRTPDGVSSGRFVITQ